MCLPSSLKLQLVFTVHLSSSEITSGVQLMACMTTISATLWCQSLICEKLSFDMCALLLQFLELNNFADYSWGGKALTGVPGGLYQGSIPYPGKLPEGMMAMSKCI